MATREPSQGIVILGLGPGEARHLTREAWEWLATRQQIYLRTRQHPVVSSLLPGLEIHSFDEYYNSSGTFEEVYAAIVRDILSLGSQPGGVTYAVPGHPFVAEATAPEIVRQAEQNGIPVRVIDGMSFLEPVFSALRLDPFPRLALLDALEIGRLHTPGFAPDTAALITQIYDRMSAAMVKTALDPVYPDEHPVRLVHAAGTASQRVEDVPLYAIDRSPHLGLMTALYLPPLGEDTSLEAFQEVVARLRAPDGCPWDREQTHLSLRRYLLEEAYEAIEALDNEDPEALREELGDLVLQILLHAQIAVEQGEFTLAEVLQGIHRKIVRRHPHVFGEAKVSGVEGVLSSWQKMKESERALNGENKPRGILDGVPGALPALSQAQEIQTRAARVGFDWKEIQPVLAKVFEELDEVHQSQDAGEREKEIGDLFFAVVNLARWHKVDAESALRLANRRFRQRFAHIEARARETSRSLTEMSLEEMDRYWEEAKGLD
ncbi:MAG: nucleoside triphosphate pyrophosphohydrolase [Bellilinea sp.]|jgi:tetrapyrrole methylase family protein/MazG family protein